MMKVDVKTPSMFIKAISILLVLTFVTGQVSASQVLSTCSGDTLAASSVIDSDINSPRSKPIQNEIAGKIEPGAIGNGVPLMMLAQGMLPDRIAMQKKFDKKLREVINCALKLYTAKKNSAPQKHFRRLQQTANNLVWLTNNLDDKVYLYSARVTSEEDYLLGFNHEGKIGLSVELIDKLYSISTKRLAQYVFRVCVPEKGIITERDDHRTVYDEILSAIFGKEEVLALGENLQRLIDEKADESTRRTRPGKSPEDAMTIIALSGLLKQGIFTLDEFLAAYEKVRTKYPDFKFEELAKNPKSTARRDLAALENDVILTVDKSSESAYRYQITDNGAATILLAQLIKWTFIAHDAFDQAVLGIDCDFYLEVFPGWRDASVKEMLAGITDKSIIEKLIYPFLRFYEKNTKFPFRRDLITVRLEDHRDAIIGLLEERIKQLATPAQTSAPAVLTTQISEDLPVRAQAFKADLILILTENPEQSFFMGIETDIGKSQKAQIMPIYKAIGQIENMIDSSGNKLFPNLKVRRAKAEELAAMASELSREGELNLSNTFIAARKISVDNRLYDSIKGEGRAWISAIDDLGTSDYMPVFEAITLNMMAYLNASVTAINADATAIKNFYDAISDKPIDPDALQDMIQNRVIYILPKATKFDTEQLRELYELACQAYIAV
jgi:hypothetical protein